MDCVLRLYLFGGRNGRFRSRALSHLKLLYCPWNNFSLCSWDWLPAAAAAAAGRRDVPQSRCSRLVCHFSPCITKRIFYALCLKASYRERSLLLINSWLLRADEMYVYYWPQGFGLKSHSKPLCWSASDEFVPLHVGKKYIIPYNDWQLL